MPLVEESTKTLARPVAPTSLTIKDLRAAIPNHCFERSTARSFMYLCVDLAMVAGLVATIWRLDGEWEDGWAKALVWVLYWWFQGAVLTGVWVIAHECGHQAFSPVKGVNWAVGYVLHSALLVPFHAWRISHATHHKKTNSMGGDTVFVPWTREEYVSKYGKESKEGMGFASKAAEVLEDTPVGTLVGMVSTLLMGWPAYLLCNASGQRYDPKKYPTVNHFTPQAPLFRPADRMNVILSDIGIFITLALLAYCSWTYSFRSVLNYYLVPYLLVNAWLVFYTYLHHTSPLLPHYTSLSHTFLRGALSAVDRDYGIYNYIHHHIGSTHVAHHLFSTMPHYHAREATVHLKRVLGEYYCQDSRSPLRGFWESFSRCKFVDPSEEGGILYWRRFVRG